MPFSPPFPRTRLSDVKLRNPSIYSILVIGAHSSGCHKTVEVAYPATKTPDKLIMNSNNKENNNYGTVKEK